MKSEMFRQIVRAEIEIWMEKNRQRFDVLTTRIAEQMAPAIQAEIERGILIRIQHVEPDEREKTAILLEQAAAFISRNYVSHPAKMNEADVLMAELTTAIATMLGR
jgi:hypothetical protein